MVIIILGIVAAIAIPVVLNQRQEGHDASAKTNIRNLADFEKIYSHDTSRYGRISGIQSMGSDALLECAKKHGPR